MIRLHVSSQRYEESHFSLTDFDTGTKTLLYNPGTSNIDVTFTTWMGARTNTQTLTLEPKKSKYSPIIPTSSGALIQSQGSKFLALSVTDTERVTDRAGGGTEQLNGQAFDWGYPVIPVEMLSSQVLVGWGYGCTNNNCLGKTERSAVWVSPVADADFWVDYENSGDASQYEQLYVKALGSTMIRDTGDHDMVSNYSVRSQGCAHITIN